MEGKANMADNAEMEEMINFAEADADDTERENVVESDSNKKDVLSRMIKGICNGKSGSLVSEEKRLKSKSNGQRLESEEFENISVSDVKEEKEVDTDLLKICEVIKNDVKESNQIKMSNGTAINETWLERDKQDVTALSNNGETENPPNRVENKQPLINEDFVSEHVEENTVAKTNTKKRVSNFEHVELPEGMILEKEEAFELNSFSRKPDNNDDTGDNTGKVNRTGSDGDGSLDNGNTSTGVNDTANDSGINRGSNVDIDENDGDAGNKSTEDSCFVDTIVFEGKPKKTEAMAVDNIGSILDTGIGNGQGLTISLREHGHLLEMRRKSESAKFGIEKPPNNYRKHSSGDLHSRLKTRKLLGVGETDDGDVHRSKLSQILGHSDQLYIRLPSGLRVWQIVLAVVITVLSVWALILPGHYFHAMYDMDGSTFTFPIRLYACALICISVIYWSTIQVSDRETIRLVLLSSIVFFSLQSCVMVLGMISSHLPATKWTVTLIGLQVICVLIGYFFYIGMLGSRSSSLKRTASAGKELNKKGE